MIRFSFPDDFLWGTGCSAFQVEGAASADGKGPSVWDAYADREPHKFHDHATPDDGADFYHRYEEDVAGMVELGLKSFRFSIAWPRIFPAGRGAVNAVGLDFYDRLIDLLLANGIEPLVDVYHWEFPEALAQDGGFLNPSIVGDFDRYARLCFERYGDRVKFWSTMNEPSACGFVGHDPVYSPISQRLSANLNILKMHFAAVRSYRQMNLKGKIGAVIPVVPMFTRSLTAIDQAAAVRQADYVHNIWLDPIMRGAYPNSLLGRPEITEHVDQAYLDVIAKHFEPVDYIGLNYYNPCVVGYVKGCLLDAEPARPFEAQSDYGFSIYPQGLFDAIMDISRRYDLPEIYVTENGLGRDSSTRTEAELLDDPDRIDYIREHLREVSRAIVAGANVKGFYYWAHFDTFESQSGYRYCFGLNHIDRKTKQRLRTRAWYYYQGVIAAGMVD